MTTWVAVIITTAAVVTAITVIWSKVLGPLARLAQAAQVYGPVLLEVGKQVKNDSGSSLKDSTDRTEQAVDRLEAAVVRAEDTAVRAEGLGERNAEALHKIQIALEGSRQVASFAAEQSERLIAALGRIDMRVANNTLLATKAADDLAASHVRADAITTGDVGEASDAAARSGSTPDQPDPA